MLIQKKRGGCNADGVEFAHLRIRVALRQHRCGECGQQAGQQAFTKYAGGLISIFPAR